MKLANPGMRQIASMFYWTANLGFQRGSLIGEPRAEKSISPALASPLGNLKSPYSV
jgi:hypothetical protein